MSRTPDTPDGALGPAPPDTRVVTENGQECAVAVFDEGRRLVNADVAIGELVATNGSPSFEGYWENEQADHDKTRYGWYWTGDLVYKDADGYLWFAGRADDWLRVDGENFAAAPVVRILERHPDVVMAAVYAVPDPVVGDQVMAALQLAPGASFDGAAFGSLPRRPERTSDPSGYHGTFASARPSRRRRPQRFSFASCAPRASSARTQYGSQSRRTRSSM